MALSTSLIVSAVILLVTGCISSALPQQHAQLPPVSVQVIVQPQRIEKPLGSSVVIPCRVRPENVPIQWLAWYDDAGRPITSDHGRVRVERQDTDGGTALATFDSTEAVGGNKAYNLLLQLHDVQPQDEGTFECRAELPGGRVLSAKAELVLYREITFEDFLGEQPLRYGQAGKVRCRVSASPPALVSWYVRYAHDGGRRHKLQTSGDNRYQQVDDGLIINNVTELDEGIYTCTATVLERTSLKDREIKVMVEREPYLEPEHYVKQINVIEGESVGIDCPINGRPVPDRTWVREHDRFDVRQIYGGRFSVDPTNGRMTIIDADVAYDEGTYICRGRNRAGQLEVAVQVNVIERPKIYGSSNATIAEGGSHTGKIWCSARGEDPLDMYIVKLRGDGSTPDTPIPWRANDAQLPAGWRLEQTAEEQYENNRAFRVQNLTLTISSPDHRRDAGLYECNAVNNAGRAQRALYVEVQHEPAFEGGPESVDRYVAINRPVNLTCLAWSIPNATVEWHKRDRREQVRGGVAPYQFQTAYDANAVPEWVSSQTYVSNDPRYRVYVNERQPSISTISFTPMTATDIDDQDLVCIAKNYLGTRLKLFRLHQAERPQGVNDVQIMEQTATAITFRINPPKWNGGFPITSYKIFYRRSSDAPDSLRTTHCAAPAVVDDDTLAKLGGNGPPNDDPMRVAVDAAVRRDTTPVPCTVSALQPDTQYIFTVVAVNFVGASDMGRSFSQELRTARPGKPQAPLIRNGTSLSGAAYLARWGEPLDNGAPITEYLIRVWPLARGATQSLDDNSGQNLAAAREYRTEGGGPITEWKLMSLRPTTRYAYTIQARNEFGLGPAAKGSFETLMGPILNPSFGTGDDIEGRRLIDEEHYRKGGVLSWLTGGKSNYYLNQPFAWSTLILILVFVLLVLVALCGLDLICYKTKHCSLFAPIWRLCCCCCRPAKLSRRERSNSATNVALQPNGKDLNGLRHSGRETAATYVVAGSSSSEQSETTPPPTPAGFIGSSNNGPSQQQQKALATAAVVKRVTLASSSSILSKNEPRRNLATVDDEFEADDYVENDFDYEEGRTGASALSNILSATNTTRVTTVAIAKQNHARTGSSSPIATTGSRNSSNDSGVNNLMGHQSTGGSAALPPVMGMTRDSGCDSDASNSDVVIIGSKALGGGGGGGGNYQGQQLNISVIAAANTGALQQQQRHRPSADSTSSSSNGFGSGTLTANTSAAARNHHQYVNVLQTNSGSATPRAVPFNATNNSIAVTSQQRLKMLYGNNNNTTGAASPLLPAYHATNTAALPPTSSRLNSINNSLYFSGPNPVGQKLAQNVNASGRFSALPLNSSSTHLNNNETGSRQQYLLRHAAPTYAAPSPAETSFDMTYNAQRSRSNSNNTTSDSVNELPSLSTTPQPQHISKQGMYSNQQNNGGHFFSNNKNSTISQQQQQAAIGITRTCSVSAGCYDSGSETGVGNIVHSSDRSLVQFETDV